MKSLSFYERLEAISIKSYRSEKSFERELRKALSCRDDILILPKSVSPAVRGLPDLIFVLEGAPCFWELKKRDFKYTDGVKDDTLRRQINYLNMAERHGVHVNIVSPSTLLKSWDHLCLFGRSLPTWLKEYRIHVREKYGL